MTAGAPRQAAPKPRQTSRVPTDAATSTPADASPNELLQALREARQAQRRRKQEWRVANRRSRAANAATGMSVEDAEHDRANSASLQHIGGQIESPAQGLRASVGGAAPEALSLRLLNVKVP